METLAERVAVVTGGASGIGLALARAFLDEGMKVVIADVEAPALDRAREELASRGDVTGVVTDVTDFGSVERLAATTFDTYGACHVVCNNAGVGAPSSLVWETTINDWRWVHGVNVMGVVHGIQAFVPRMIAAGDPGYIVNTSSGDGGIAPMPAASVYAASKAAVTSLTECLASQLDLRRHQPARRDLLSVRRVAAHRALDRGSQSSGRARARTAACDGGDDDREARGHGQARRPRAQVPRSRRARAVSSSTASAPNASS